MALALLLALLLPGMPADPPTAPATVIEGKWIGVMDFRDHQGQKLMPTDVTLEVHEDGTITGDWRSRSRTAVNSGQITGRIDDKGHLKFTVTLHAVGVGPDQQVIGLERCAGSGEFSAILTPSAVLRLTTPIILSNTVQNEARGKNCDNPTRVVWTLQRP